MQLPGNFAQSRLVEKVYCAPGNGGTYLEEKCENISVKSTDFEQLIDFVKKTVLI